MSVESFYCDCCDRQIMKCGSHCPTYCCPEACLCPDIQALDLQVNEEAEFADCEQKEMDKRGW